MLLFDFFEPQEGKIPAENWTFAHLKRLAQSVMIQKHLSKKQAFRLCFLLGCALRVPEKMVRASSPSGRCRSQREDFRCTNVALSFLPPISGREILPHRGETKECEHRLPLPLGEVAERSEAGEVIA